jgi:uncharacterized membrane protein YebE (DUF533 family)
MQHPLRTPSRPVSIHLRAIPFADRIRDALNAADKPDGFPSKCRSGGHKIITRSTAITLALALVDAAIADGRIDPTELLATITDDGPCR